MPAQSKQQQKFMGMVHALKKGDMKPSDASPELKKAAQSMSDKDAKDFASTSHKGLPKKVKQEILNKLKEYANSMGRDHLGGDDYTSSKKGGLRDFDGYDNVDYNRDMPMDEGFKSEYKGNDGIIWKKGKTQGGVTNFTPYYKGHNIEFGGHNFKTEKELKDFINDYILSNQLYNKYRFEGKLPNNWMQGRVSDYHTSLRGKKKDYSGGTNFRKDNSGQPDLEDEKTEGIHSYSAMSATRAALKRKKRKEGVNEFMMPRDIDSKMKELGISKIPISSQGEKILKGMVNEKFLDKITNKERLIYFVESLGKEKFGYGSKGKPLSPLVDRFWNDITTEAIFFGGKMAAYSVAMNIKDIKRSGKQIDSPYEMLKEYFKNFGINYNGSRVFDSAIRNLEDWMKRNKIQESVTEAQAVSGGKVHKFITGKNITLKGKKYSDVDFELVSIDNKTQIVKLKVLAPKELFGQEINMDFRTIRRGPFLKTNTSMGESVNEAGLKGVEGIPSNKKLSQLSDNDKLKVLQSTGNLISFKVPDWSKGKRNFWTVISAGKIIKKKNLSGEIIFFLPGKGPEKASPTYPSVKELLNGVDWDTMELRRESVNEAADTNSLKKIHDGIFKFLKTKKGVGEVKEFSEFPNRHGDNVSTFSVKYNIEDRYNYDLQEIKIEYSTSRVFIPNKGYFPFKTFNDIKNIINKKSSLKEYGQRLDLSYLEDDEAKLDGTPKPKDAIDRNIDEAMIRRASDIAHKLIPKDTWSRYVSFTDNNSKNKEFVKSMVRDLAQSLNRFYKTYDINVKIQENQEDNNNIDMVLGILSILKQIKDPENRKKVAVDMIRKFKEDDINFDYQEFINLMKEYSMGSYEYNK